MYLGLTSLGLRPAPFAASPITQLFQSGEPGAVFIAQKPSEWASADLITMFQDNAGTTPVTALEQTVGLHLDTRPIFLGPELVTNGKFETDTTGWTAANGATLSAVGGQLVILNSTAIATGYYTISTRAGATYRVFYSIPSASGATGRVSVQSSAAASYAGDLYWKTGITSGTIGASFDFTATTAQSALSLITNVASGANSTNWDNISVREVISAPNTVGQPLWGPQVWDNANATFSGSASQVSPGVYRILSTDGTISAVFSNSGPARMLNGAWYEATFNIDSVTTAGAGLTVDSGLGGGPSIPATVGPKRCIFQSVGTSFASIKRAGGVTDIQISNLQFRQVYGNHRSQSSSGARPRLSARYNKVTAKNANPTDLTGVSVSGDAAAVLTLVNDAAALASAGLSARCTLGNVYKVDATACASPVFALFTGQSGNLNNHTASAYLRGSGACRFQSGGNPTINLTASYMSYSQNWVATATTSTFSVRLDPGAVCYVILPDFRESCYSYLPTPQVVWDGTTGYDDTGFPARLVYSGAQGMVTGDIDLSVTDKVQTFSAITKLDDSAVRAVYEFTGSSGVTQGSFALFAPVAAASSNFEFRSGGTTVTVGVQTAAAAPYASVVTGQADISAPFVSLRTGGALRNTNTATQGTGNYAVDKLYFGSRGGSGITYPLIGDEFISIVRGGSTPVTGTVYQIEQTCARYMGMNI